MKIDEINVEVNAEVRISDETVNCCLKLIQIYLNDNPDKELFGGIRKGNGKVEKLRIVPQKQYAFVKGRKKTKEMCEQCGESFYAGPYSHLCPACIKERQAEGRRKAALISDDCKTCGRDSQTELQTGSFSH